MNQNKQPKLSWAFTIISIGMAVVLSIYALGINNHLMLDGNNSLAIYLQHEDWNFEKLLDLVLSESSGPTGRPVSMASFAMQHWLGGMSTENFKTLNVLIHGMNGVLLFVFLRRLARDFCESGFGANNDAVIALIVVVWMVLPIHVSTVLYAVQRMTQLAFTYSLACLVLYSYFRENLAKLKLSSIFLTATVFSLTFVLGVFAKENAIVVLPLVVAYEFGCRTNREADNIVTLRRFMLASAILSLGAVLVYLISNQFFYEGYQRRTFTVEERLFTQGSVLIDYLSQIVFPDITRMGLYHDDFPISQSLVSPISTLVSWLAILTAFCLAGVYINRGHFSNFLSYSFLFFFIGHLLESTFIPLEIYFEHRNYLPSIGYCLFLFFVYSKFARFGRVTKWFLVGMIFVYGWLTVQLVSIWSSPPALVLQHINAHPSSRRANLDAAELLARQGDLANSLKFSARVYSLSDAERSGDWFVRDLLLHCYARVAPSNNFFEKGEYQRSGRYMGDKQPVILLRKALHNGTCEESIVRSGFIVLHKNLVSIDMPVEAYGNAAVYSNLAVLANDLGLPELALEAIDIALRLDSSAETEIVQIHLLLSAGKVDEARLIFESLVLSGRADSDLGPWNKRSMDFYGSYFLSL